MGITIENIRLNKKIMSKQNSYNYDELLSCGHGELFGPGNAQLPLPPMLMFNRITRISNEGGTYGKGEIKAELDVTPDLWFFDCHFENDPVVSDGLPVSRASSESAWFAARREAAANENCRPIAGAQG